ncbi:uncharacterized protein Dana_GF20057 [Drosophila ananassae]|uniref:Ionotropic glutamate receptor C-terminal domain-containing protein n=1 Tax=Drosophila ananassae TaxID=7217 RepID=B3M5B0_DROAN|nr:uncharacterized protein LOC6502781 [Drosophila ananassae]EDV40615.1 uncharacterized protein Dana_GF20057 [Drosophila ananassae]
MALLYINTLQNLSLFGGNRLVEAIHELNRYYPSEIIVYLEFGDGSDVLEESKQPLRQTLWFKNPIFQTVLEGNFSSSTITVLYLEDKYLESGINYLTNWLWKYQHLHVIIFYKNGKVERLHKIFKKCFDQGLPNLLVILPEFEGFYTFQPFPEVRILHLNRVEEYYDKSLLKWNLLGYNVTIGLVTAGAPRWFSFRDRHNRLILTGYMLRTVVDFANNFNGTIDLVDIKTVNEGLELLANRSIDFFPFLIRPLDTFAMTSILYLENCGLIVPSSRLLPNFLYVSSPYTFTSWITWLIMLVYCSLALKILYKGQFSLSETFLQILRLALYLSGGKEMGARPSHHRFLLFFILTHSGFILTNLYLAKLSSNLAAGLYEKQINTWDDLDKSDSVWPLIDVDVETMQKLIPDRKNLIKRIVTTPELDVDEYRRNLNTSCIHSGFFDRIEFALYQQQYLRFPIFRKFPHILYQQPMQISTHFGQPYLQFFNSFVIRIFESGIFLKIKDDAYRHGIESGLLNYGFQDRNMEVKSNDVEYYYLIGGLWLGGLLLATICFCFEILTKKIKITVKIVSKL